MKSKWDNETIERHAETMRKMNEHENQLLNMRFTWFTTLQGLLFASFGIVWKEHLVFINCIICVMGIIVALSFLSSIRLSTAAYEQLEKWWSENLNVYDGPPMKALKVTGKLTFIRRFRPWRVLPIAFILTWVLILGYSILFN